MDGYYQVSRDDLIAAFETWIDAGITVCPAETMADALLAHLGQVWVDALLGEEAKGLLPADLRTQLEGFESGAPNELSFSAPCNGEVDREAVEGALSYSSMGDDVAPLNGYGLSHTRMLPNPGGAS